MARFNATRSFAQARAAVDVGRELLKKGGPIKMYLERYLPRMEEATDRLRRAIAESKSATERFFRETDEARAKADELSDAVKTALAFMSLEIEFAEKPDIDLYAKSYAEILLNGETALQLLDDYGRDLFFYDETRSDLSRLTDELRKEHSEGVEAEEAYHDAVDERRTAQRQARQLVKRIKTAVRRFYGVDSEYYQSLKDSRFVRTSKGGSGEAAEVDVADGVEE